ncbi:DDE-type integrase/transposase/recombinase, partial [Tenacibaculum amylolyticum]|uniref:DDE-type integrase/transposase/recombinase n=1 Tax=Tenacibaculum amylolyticum TaxID=104269 RepID=UPI0038B5AF47
MQLYHSNATTNAHLRKEIQQSTLTSNKLSEKYKISLSTVKKWRNRDYTTDRSSKPKTVHYSLTYYEQELIVALRRATWLPLDDLGYMVFSNQYLKQRSAIYRTFKRYGVNKVPKEHKEKAKKFKEYNPGFLHVDVTYLPKINGNRKYLFVAIDRATRMVYFKIYGSKTSENAKNFVSDCIKFYPFKLTHILTDNGLEFTNYLLKSKKGEPCKKPSKVDLI